ncbi:MAG: C25 family cysteine peptidase [Candidatus Thorarchaeota archaeon]
MRESRRWFSSQRKINLPIKVKITSLTIVMILLLLHTGLMVPPLLLSNMGSSNRQHGGNDSAGMESIFEPEVVLSENGEWVTFIDGASPGTRSIVIPKSRDTMGLCVDSTFYGMYNYTETIASIRFNILSVPSAGHASEIGKPAVPLVTRYLEVPHDVNITARVLYSESAELSDYYVIPAQREIADIPNATVPDFEYHNATYFEDSFYPENIAMIDGGVPSEEIIIRGHRVVALTLYPIQFNPVQSQLLVYSKIEVRLDYIRPAQVEAIPERLQSSAFSDFCNGLILNYKYSPTFKQIQASANLPHSTVISENGNGAEYLIITNDTFYDNILPLADWKEKKGLLTKVVKASEINPTTPTAAQVANYIQNAYDTWNPAPSYILFVGDSDHILPHYQTLCWDDDYHGAFNTATDLYYGTVEGTDYFPDIFVGRLSVDTPAEVATIVDKILSYERTPPNPTTYPEFYSNIAAPAFFQEHDLFANREGRDYVRTSEDILRLGTYNGLESMGYTAHRIYDTDAANPLTYRDGTAIPNDLQMANGFLWNGDNAQITSNLTDGRFLMYHRDHGASRNGFNHDTGFFANADGWNHPGYFVADVTGLTNDPLLPLVLSIECQCGWYDGEVDQEAWGGGDAALTRDVESFSEEFLRRSGGGAIAVIGASRNSPSFTNDRFLKGIIDGIWPTFDTDYNSGGLFSFAQLMLYGKVYAAQFDIYNSDVLREEFELYNLFGDPETMLWTSAPGTLNVLYPSTIGSTGTQDFVVYVTDDGSGDPINNAKICLRRGTDIYEVKLTDPLGYAYFSLSPGAGGDIEITVTSHDYEPHEGTISVTSNGATLTVDPDMGPGGGSVDLTGSNFGDEAVSIEFGGTALAATAVAGSFSDSYTVPIDGAGPLNIIATGQVTGRVAVTLFRRMPDGVDLYTYDQRDSSTWNLNPAGNNPVWNSPTIQLYDKLTGAAVSSNDLIVGRAYTVKTTIYNRATVTATDAIVTFKWAIIGGGQVNRYPMNPDTVTVTVPAAIAIVNYVEGQVEAEVDWTPEVTGHICVLVDITHPWDVNLDDNQGQENTDVHPVSSPGTVELIAGNPTDAPALVYIEVRQLGNLNDIWNVTVERDYPQELEPRTNQTVRFVVDAPESAELNETRTFIVNMYIDGELMGGVQIEVVK